MTHQVIIDDLINADKKEAEHDEKWKRLKGAEDKIKTYFNIPNFSSKWNNFVKQVIRCQQKEFSFSNYLASLNSEPKSTCRVRHVTLVTLLPWETDQKSKDHYQNQGYASLCFYLFYQFKSHKNEINAISTITFFFNL